MSPKRPNAVCVIIVFASSAFQTVNSQWDNVALNKPASQSRQFDSREARYAVDGDISTSNLRRCATSTATSSSSVWWQVDLGELFVVSGVTVYVADDTGDKKHATNFHIFVATSNSTDGTPICASQGSDVITGSKMFNCSQLLIGRYVIIRKTGGTNAVVLCEVIVYGTNFDMPLPLENIAQGKPATQSSTYQSRTADKAVDGRLDTSPADICATPVPDTDNYAWWQVDLGDLYVVSSVTLYVANDANAISSTTTTTTVAPAPTTTTTISTSTTPTLTPIAETQRPGSTTLSTTDANATSNTTPRIDESSSTQPANGNASNINKGLLAAVIVLAVLLGLSLIVHVVVTLIVCRQNRNATNTSQTDEQQNYQELQPSPTQPQASVYTTISKIGDNKEHGGETPYEIV